MKKWSRESIVKNTDCIFFHGQDGALSSVEYQPLRATVLQFGFGLCGAAGERGQLGTLADGNHVLIGGLALLY